MEQNQSEISEETNENKNASVEKGPKRKKVLIKITLALTFIALLSFLYWFYFVRNRAWTDDAYVNGNSIALMSPQAGIVVSILADDTDYVEQGQTLVQLDTTTFELTFERAKVALALAARQVRQLQEDVGQKRAELALQKANYIRALQDFESRQNIENPQAIAKEDLNHARASLEVAEANVRLAHHQLEASIVALGNTSLQYHPTIENAKVPLREAYVNLLRTRILSPVTGFVAKRNVQVGEWVTPSRALMSIIPLNQIWIDANFKETELTDVRMDQPVTITTDIYGSDVVYHGKVDGIEAGTGSVFSLLPPQNASGNWIKIVQRLPVRIYLNPDELKTHPLRLGLSAYVTIDTTDTKGKMLAEVPNAKPKFETPVFTPNMEPIEQLIEEIIRNNLSFQGQGLHDNS